jgi:hypothetical protein
MLVKDVVVEYPSAMTEAEAAQYAEDEMAIWAGMGKQLAQIIIALEGDEVVIRTLERSPIRRVRRITGYLSEVANFNDAKQAELKARVTHKFS